MLIHAALQGEEEAFIQLYHRYVPQLYYFIYQKVNSQPDAEDLTSETFYNALKNLKSFAGKSSFKNWLYGIAKHLILAYYRNKYQKPVAELDENIMIPPEEENPQEDPKTLTLMGDILKRLPRNHRSVLELRFLKGYSVLETAEALGISEENAKVIQHRALKKANQLALELNCNPSAT